MPDYEDDSPDGYYIESPRKVFRRIEWIKPYVDKINIWFTEDPRYDMRGACSCGSTLVRGVRCRTDLCYTGESYFSTSYASVKKSVFSSVWILTTPARTRDTRMREARCSEMFTRLLNSFVVILSLASR